MGPDGTPFKAFSYEVSIGLPVPGTALSMGQELYKYLLDVLINGHRRYRQWFHLGGNIAMENSRTRSFGVAVMKFVFHGGDKSSK